MIKRLRLDLGLTQEEMAEKLNISTNAYRNYENGIRVLPYNVLINFLKLRSSDEDLRLLNTLEGLYVEL